MVDAEIAAEAGLQNCPKCGAKLSRRLDEFECSDCGYFVSAANFSQAKKTKSRSSHQYAKDLVDRPRAGQQHASYAEGLTGKSQGSNAGNRHDLLSKLRLTFLIAVPVLLGLSYFAEFGQAIIVNPQYAVRIPLSLIICTATAAAALYIDWIQFRRIAFYISIVLTAIHVTLYVLAYSSTQAALQAGQGQAISSGSVTAFCLTLVLFMGANVILGYDYYLNRDE